MRIILLGPPAVGKGTQADILADTFKIPHISTGDMMRSAIANHTELGMKCKSCMDKGELVPDEIVVGIVSERLNEPDCQTGFILDGFPRTVPQAEDLDAVLKERSIDDVLVVELTVEDEVLFERIKKRQASGAGRSDDNDETLRHRLEVFRSETAPVSDYYQRTRGVKFVSSMGTIEEVQKGILEVIKG